MFKKLIQNLLFYLKNYPCHIRLAKLYGIRATWFKPANRVLIKLQNPKFYNKNGEESCN